MILTLVIVAAVDIAKLEEAYAEVETPDWHEDTWEWHARRNEQLFRTTMNEDILIKKAQKDPAKLRIGKIYLADGTCRDCTQVAKAFQAYLLSGGRTSVRVDSPRQDRLRVEFVYGDFSAAKDAILARPQVRKLFWNGWVLYGDHDLGRKERAADEARGIFSKIKEPPDF